MERLLVVIVNTKTPEMVIDCLESLAPEIELVPETRVVIVDNPMGDNSVELINAAIQSNAFDWCEVTRSDMNGGFGYGNNVAIRAALQGAERPEYIMLLNPDTIVRPRALRELVDFMDANPKAGICGSQLEDPDGGRDVSAHRAPTPLSEGIHAARLGFLDRTFSDSIDRLPIADDNLQCDWVTGAALFARTEVYEQIGLLDQAFFVYYEETDLCQRARDRGWEVWYVPSSLILHLEGQTTGLGVAKQPRPAFWYNSRRRYFVKHHGVIGLLLADLGWCIGRASLVIRSALGLGGDTAGDPARFMWDLVYGDIKALFNGSIFRLSDRSLTLEEARRLGH